MRLILWIRQRPNAFATTISHGTWIIGSVAMATVLAAAAAVPGSPVHHWVHHAIREITCISASATTCASPAGGSTTSTSGSSAPTYTSAPTTVLWTFTGVSASASATVPAPGSSSTLDVGVPLSVAVASVAQSEGTIPLSLTINPAG